MCVCVPVCLSAGGWGLISQTPAASLLPQVRGLGLPSANSEGHNNQTLAAWREITTMRHGPWGGETSVRSLRSALRKAWAQPFAVRVLRLSLLTSGVAVMGIDLAPVPLWPRGWADGVSLPCEEALSYGTCSPFAQAMLCMRRGWERLSYFTWRRLRALSLPTFTTSLQRR